MTSLELYDINCDPWNLPLFTEDKEGDEGEEGNSSTDVKEQER